jgi:ribosomal protein S18 acetylase RimI-like enzyme
MTYVQQTMESKKEVCFESRDKLGTSVIFELEKTDGQSTMLSKKNKELGEIYSQTFAYSCINLLKANPELVLTIDKYKPFKSLIEKQGIENVDWRRIEGKIQKFITRDFKEIITLPKNAVGWFVIVKNKETTLPIGFLQFSVSSDETFESVRINKMALEPEAQHRGLGKLMISSILNLLPKTTHMWLRVLKTNPQAQNAYSSYGFVKCLPPKEDEQAPYLLYFEYKTTQKNILQKAAETLLVEKKATKKS